MKGSHGGDFSDVLSANFSDPTYVLPEIDLNLLVDAMGTMEFSNEDGTSHLMFTVSNKTPKDQFNVQTSLTWEDSALQMSYAVTTNNKPRLAGFGNVLYENNAYSASFADTELKISTNFDGEYSVTPSDW